MIGIGCLWCQVVDIVLGRRLGRHGILQVI